MTGGRPSLAVMLAATLLVAALSMGGGKAGSGTIVVHGLAGAALALAAFRWRSGLSTPFVRAMNWLLASAMLLALLQLVPLPVEVFAALPRRSAVVADLRSAGLQPAWLPMTLDWSGTLRTLLGLQAFAGMWFLASTLHVDERIRLLKLALLAGVVLAAMGFAQASAKADTTGAQATFANRNHFASLMAMLVPFAFAMSTRGGMRRLLAYCAAAVLLLAAAMSFSRAGSLLALSSAIASLLLLRQPRTHEKPRHVVAAAGSVLLVAALVFYYAWEKLGARFGSSLVDDLRWKYLENGAHALAAYFPWGSGLGSFRWVYQGFEPETGMGEFTFATHAHNELLEIGIEAGLPALLVVSVFLLLVIAAARAVGKQPGAVWPRAAVIACSVPLLHSLVDLPLRTQACSITLALVLAVMCAPPPRAALR